MKYKIGIVVSDFNSEITSKMERHAEKIAKKLNLEITRKIHVPGSFELPFAANKLLQDKEINALAVLGAVIQGETHHDVILVNAVAEKLIGLSLKYSKPVGFGIIGPRVKWKQAESRAEEYAERAVKAVYELIKIK